MIITIMSISYERTLYFGITINDNLHCNDFLGVVFRTSEEELIYGLESRLYTFGGKFDFKTFYVSINNSKDGYTMNTYLDGYIDTDMGGTDDTLGKCTYSGGSYFIEFSMPFNSYDSIGADIAINSGDKVEIFLLNKNDSDTLFTQIREYDEDFDYCILYLGCNFRLPLSPFSLLLGLFLIAGINAITKKRKMK